jgi:hypothetical protein
MCNSMTDCYFGEDPDGDNPCTYWIEQGLCKGDCEYCGLCEPDVDDLTDEE